ncbi:MAG TPA: cyclase family protein [Blastocatellia bacterium]|nr:cyclase family protein [Blastocatellia bacterium]
MKIHDITVSISSDLPVYPGDPEIQIRPTLSMAAGDICCVSQLSFGTHIGTHVDPPAHFVRGGATLDQLPLDVLIGPARVIDVGEEPFIDAAVLARANLDGVSRVLFKTRNSRLWHSAKEFQKSFVYLETDAAGMLVERGVRLVGIDYLSVEKFDFEVPATHYALLRNNVIIVEGLDLSAVAPGDYELICLPLKLRDGDGGPARVVLRELS